MAHVIVSSIVSLDGMSEGPQHGVMDLPMDRAFDAHNRALIESADTVLLGRRSYEFFGAYWPSVQHHPPVDGSDPVAAQMYSDDCRAISRRYDEVEVLAVSDSLVLDASSPWRDHTTVVPRASVGEVLAARDGRCVVFGSRVLANALLAQGLVDELHLVVGSRWLGGGTPFLDAPADLRLLDVRRPEGSDNVVLVNAPVPASGTAGHAGA